MQKILDAFIATSSLANARKLAAHVRRHPMVMCMLTADHASIVDQALRLVEREG
jgi:hypothetical protein